MIREWAKRNVEGDPVIWFIVIALSGLGVLVVYSTTSTLAYRMQEGNTEYYLFKHGLLLALSLGAMWITHKIDYRYFARISTIALLFSVPLLLFTWKFGQNINDASRWITIPMVNQAFQPSDLAKLALIAHLAGMLSRRQQVVNNFKVIIGPMAWCCVICGLIALTNFSSAIMLFATCMLLLFIGRVPVRYIFSLILVGLLFVTIALSLGQRKGTAISRIKNFASNDTEEPFQAVQAYIAIATGKVYGKGWGKSEQRNFLPSSYSDFIYAIIIEEYGIIGGILVICCYLILLYRGMLAVSRSERAFGGLLSAGLSFAIVIQAMINMGVAVGLGPITGLPLPLVSMGGTSLLFTGIAIGIILSVSKSGVAETESKMLKNSFAR